MSQKLYILVKEDLTPAQKIVQAAHAVQAWTIMFKPTGVYTKVVCDVSDWDYDIQKRKMHQRMIQYAEFKEPDMGNRPTALAVLYDGNMFSHLPLVGEDRDLEMRPGR